MRTNYMLAKPGERGDCLRASLSSLLDVEALAVPHFLDIPETEPWWPALSAWLADRGLYPIEQSADICTPPGLYLALGKVPGGEGHCVVARGGKVVWDPRPKANRTDFSVESVIMLVVTDAAALYRWKSSLVPGYCP